MSKRHFHLYRSNKEEEKDLFRKKRQLRSLCIQAGNQGKGTQGRGIPGGQRIHRAIHSFTSGRAVMVYGSTDGKTGKPATPNSLAFQWQAFMLQEHGREVLVNSENLARLKHFIRVAGSDAQAVFTHGLSEWRKFRSTVYQSGEHDSLPAFPDIWFFAKHVSLLKTMFDNKDKPKSEYQIPADQHAADSASNPEEMATPEQVFATLETLAAMKAAKEKQNT